ncbi:MAG: HipA domain-containing protein [Bacteroidales bacterium]|nr:HipA domain-containing protein [Bacteroidales bacterium]MBR4646510.1 HipA domain-containing protein [Bacteroidales bacterium]
MAKCLYCYQDLEEGMVDFHPQCAKRFFGTTAVPAFPYKHSEIKELAKEVVRSQTAVTGVQAKLSMDIEKMQHETRFTIVGLWGRFILKPQTELYPHLPELEDLTMHLAETAHIQVVPHTLVRFADGELCYLTRRVDRTQKGEKIPMEDMCQLSQKLTEHKYRGSHEQIAKIIMLYSSAPKLDLVRFWEVVLFSWITGNSDMHLKNFSIYSPFPDNYQLAPAYDLLNTLLVMPSDKEELALTLNAKKKKIKAQDFVSAMINSGLDGKVIQNMFQRFHLAEEKWYDWIENSFLPQEMKTGYTMMIKERMSRLNIEQ